MNERPNPYVGLRALKTGETLYGREYELRQVQSLLIAERILLLHSPSGAGKTSFIQAGLIPAMREQDFNVLPVVRVGLEPPTSLPLPDNFNRYLYSMLVSLEEALSFEERMQQDELLTISLDEYLTRRPRSGDDPESVLLILDQFEEILFADPADRAGKMAFFNLLGVALRNHDRWALIAMREDYMGGLAPYVRPIPGQLENRYRLTPFGVPAALQVIQTLARRQGVDFTDAAAHKLVDDLRRVQYEKPNREIETVLGEEVEPVQLQAVCYRLWRSLAADDVVIDLDDIAAVGDVDQSLAEYYTLGLQNAAVQTGLGERALREWVENKLIAREGFRVPVPMGPDSTAGLDNRAVHLLAEAHLLNAEKRAGVTWFELSHDRLVKPVRQSNAAWFDENFSPLQKQAMWWEKQGKPEGMLLRGEALKNAEKEFASQPLNETEGDFLAACQNLRKREQREKLQQQIVIASLALSIVLLAVAVFFGLRADAATQDAERKAAAALTSEARAQANWMEALIEKSKADTLLQVAEEKSNKARAGELSAQSVALQESDFALSTLLGIDAIKFSNSYQIKKSLLGSLTRFPDVAQFIPVNDYLRAIALSPDGKILAIGRCDAGMICRSGDVTLWDWQAHRAIGTLRTNTEENGTYSLAFSLDGKKLAVGSYANITLWDVESQKMIGQTPPEEWQGFAGLAFSLDGNTLISSSAVGVTLWDALTLQSLGNLPAESQPGVSLALSPDGKLVAAGGYGPVITIWDFNSRRVFASIPVSQGSVCCLLFSPDSKMLVVGVRDENGDSTLIWDVDAGQFTGGPIQGMQPEFSRDGKILATSNNNEGTLSLWDVPTRQLILGPISVPGVSKMIFTPDGKKLIVGYGDDILYLLNLPPRPNMVKLLAANLSLIHTLAFNPAGKNIAIGHDDHSISLWNAETGQQAGPPLIGHQGPVMSLAFRPDGKMLASGSDDATIILWNTADGKSIGQPLTGHPATVAAVAFSQDGKKLASESIDSAGNTTVVLWDVATGKMLGQNAIDFSKTFAASIAFSPNSEMLAMVLGDQVVVLDLTSPGLSAKKFPEVYNPIQRVFFDPTGETILSIDLRSGIIAWDVKTGRPLNIELPQPDMWGDGGGLDRPAAIFSLDGKIAIDLNMNLWDVGSQQVIGALPIDYIIPAPNATSGDGNLLAVVNKDRTDIFLISLNPQTWATQSCQRIGRNLTRIEWAKYYPGDPYRAICPQWPIEPESTATPVP